jgi:two-component system, OmpR family, sensor histidine kinase KdpD
MNRDLNALAAGVIALAAIVFTYQRWLHVTNATTVALTFLLVVLVIATTSTLWVAAVISLAAMLCINYFFLPPVGTWTIADPQNWVALCSFLAVSLVASNLSSVARARTGEAIARRDEVARLFDLSRDILLTTDSRDAFPQLARFISRRFDLSYAGVCLPREGAWNTYGAGALDIAIGPSELDRAFADVEATLEFDARARTYSGQRDVTIDGHRVRLVPLRLGTRPVGLLAAAGGRVDPGTLDAIAGVAAIAIERAQFLEERKTAELARQGEELKSALLASIGHDLRTPLTAIRVAASNLQAAWLSQDERREQGELVLAEVERLTRLFQNILEMARIDAGAIASAPRWIDVTELVAAAREQVAHTLAAHRVDLTHTGAGLVRIDPLLTAAALSHVLENAAQYTPGGAPIAVRTIAEGGELVVTVRDRGPGIAPADLPQLFDRFYRGAQAKSRVSGTGMGLSIARGLLAAEGGRIWAENSPGGGAVFTIAVPVESRMADEAGEAS